MPETLTEELHQILKKFPDSSIKKTFLARIDQGELTRDENKQSHFCVYFAAFDPELAEIFIGLHIKSGLYLVNGGHLDLGESVRNGKDREMDEEWGYQLPANYNLEPELLTMAHIAGANYSCQTHFDLWHFVAVKKSDFKPDKQQLAKEYSQIDWLTISEARSQVTDPGNQEALYFIEHQLIPRSPKPITLRRTKKGR